MKKHNLTSSRHSKSVCLILGFVLFCSSCHQPKEKELVGLYQLTELNVDGMNRPIGPELLDLKSDGTFAISRVTGDHVGFYQLKGTKIKFVSEAGDRFNARWQLQLVQTRLQLQGLDEGYTVTRMTFDPIKKVPRFDDFEDQVIGRWQIYKSRQLNKVQRVEDTYLMIDRRGEYTIKVNGQLVEKGMARVNTRHHKLIFEYEDTEWRAWFYGDELRLTNPKNGFQFDLKRTD